MYSVTDRKSFEGISYWTKSLDENCKEGISKVLVGNKTDLEDMRQVTAAEGRDVAEKNKMLFYEASAKTGINVEELFVNVARDIVLKHPGIVVESAAGKRLTAAPADKTSGGCC